MSYPLRATTLRRNDLSPSWLNLSHFSVLFLLLLSQLVGCASKHPKTTEIPQPPKISGSDNVSRVTPVDPTSQLPMPPPLTQVPPETTHHEAGNIALVLGGAGVASFATIGILKRFHEEGLKVDVIVTTGWPSLFALGYGLLKSVHDVEWFAMRLTEADLKTIANFDLTKDFSPDAPLSKLLETTFGKKDLSESRIPIVVSSANTDLGEAETFIRGEWKTPLAKTMSIPGLFRKFPAQNGWVAKAEAMDVDEAFRQQARTVVAVEMYDDYLAANKGREYAQRLKDDLASQLERAHVKGKIVMGKGPMDLSQKRLAIVLGYKEGIRLAKLIKGLK